MSMQRLYIRLTALSPLAIRSDHAPGGAVTASYIPCTTFIGALAEVHRLLRSNDVDDFAQWFLRGQVLFPNLYPAIFDDPDLQNRNVPVYPVPRTAQTCKRHGGFLFPVKEENDAHGVRDSLIDWALFELGQNKEYNSDNVDSLVALEGHKECRRCGERMDSLGGFYRRNDVVKNQLIAAKERKRLSTHSGIDRASGTVQEGILFNRQVFEEGMRFWGMVKLPDDEQLISAFTRFINELGSEGLLRIGTGRTRGMGKVTINVERPVVPPKERSKEPLDPFESFQQRLNNFDDLLHGQAQRFNLHNLQNKFFFVLTLHSPLILHDELLRYRGNIDTSTLERLLKEKLYDRSVPGLEHVYQNARLRRIAGWQELWGMPRTNEYAIEAGSVFLFACSSKPDNALYRALFALEEQGIGNRLSEGFGRVCVSDQFHQEIELL